MTEELLALLEDLEVQEALRRAVGVRPRPLEEAIRGITEILAEAEREWQAKRKEEEA